MHNETKYNVNLINQKHAWLRQFMPDGKSAFARFEDGGEGQPPAAADPPAGDPPAAAGDPPVSTPPAASPPATPPAVAPTLLSDAGLVNPDGTFVADWYKSDKLPEEVRGSDSLSVIKDLAGLAKRTVHAEKMVGKNKIVVPKADAPAEEWATFQAALAQANPALAVPDTAADYKFDVPDGLETVITDERLTASKELAKKIGVTQAQFEQFMAADAAQAIEAKQQAQIEADRQHDADELALKKEWGVAYEERVHVVKRLIAEAFGTDEPGKLDFLEKFAGNPDFVRFAAVVGSRMVESKALVAELTNSTPTESLERIRKLEATPGYMSMGSDMTDAQRTEITQQIRNEMQIAYPDEG